jgi:hypothetical protein
MIAEAKTPVTIHTVPQTADLPVICAECGNPRRPRDMVKFQGKRMCTSCSMEKQQEAVQRRTASEMEADLRELLFRQLDLRMATGPGERQPPDPTIVLESFYETYGGPHEFGRQWAEVVKSAADRAINDRVGAVQAARMMLDVHRATAASHDAFQDRDIERMSLEEAKAERQKLIAAEYAAMAKDAVSTRLLEVLKVMLEDPKATDFDGFLEDMQRTMDDARQKTLALPQPEQPEAGKEASGG